MAQSNTSTGLRPVAARTGENAMTAFELMVAFGMLDSYVRDGETRVRLPGGVRVSTPCGCEFTIRNEDGLVLRLPDTATIDELIRALREAGVPL